MASNVSADLLWEIVRPNNAFLVKRGAFQFSRDPLNLMNKPSRKYSGFINDKALGVQSAKGGKGGVTLHTKKVAHANKPAANGHQVTWSSKTSTRKTYRGIVNSTTKRGYRSDLRHEAIARASAIRQSQLKKKDLPEKKLRGTKAGKAAEKKTE